MEPNTIKLHSSPLPLELPRVQDTHQNFQETQTTISADQEQDSEISLKCSSSNTLQANHDEVGVHEVHVVEETSNRGGEVGEVVESCGRERLRRHGVEVGGRVWIPEIWGQEELLKEWIDCNGLDAAVVSSGVMSARAALIEEGRRANSGRLRIENRCW